jgi:two-component system chemotaxis response regulator CheY
MATVLVIDDTAVLRKIIKFNLEKAGYKVEEAIDGYDGLEKVKSVKPDLILLDLMMPRLDGFGFMEKIKNTEEKDVPIVVLTAKGSKEDIDRVKALGANDFMNKPFSPKDLVQKVGDILK